MKKNLILTSVAAIMTTIAGANAATDLTFDGKYSLATDAEGTKSGNVNSEPIESNFKYSYSTFDGTNVTEHNNVSYDSETEPDYANIKYLNPDGDAVAYTADTEIKDAQEYTKPVSAERTITMKEGTADEYVLTIKTAAAGQNLYANGTANKANYTYQADGGEEFSLADQPKFTETYDLLTGADSKIEFIGDNASVSATNGVTEDSLDGSQYVLHASNGIDFRLTTDGSEFRRVSDGATVSVADYSDYADEFTALQTAYNDDKAALANLVTNTQNSYDAVKDNYEAALGLFEEDNNAIADLTRAFESQEKAKGLYEQAEANYAKAGKEFADSHAAHEAASKLYNASIMGTIADGANDAIDASVESGSIKTALDTKANTADVELALNGKADKATTLSGYGIEDAYTKSDVDTLISNEATARSDADDVLQLNIDAEKDRATAAEDALQQAIADEATARSNADQQLQQQINASIANSDALTLSKANSYTDAKVNTLEKNMSGGVAAATALSSVAVSNVGKGEVSVGGGYGYYNSQSAIAFGAAMGLSDRWSVNAGAGIASGDKTQVSFRAGTNYKFKLF